MPRSRVIRKTKVIATIGPASDSLETMKAMIRAGMNVARLNFSHGTHEEHRKRLESVRQAASELSANIGIMLDTKGVEIRTGRLEGGTALLAAVYGGSAPIADRMAPARSLTREVPQYEAGAPMPLVPSASTSPAATPGPL